jgi:transposase
MIIGAGHRLVYRAPYYPVDGPIEYVFNIIQQELAYQMHYIKDLPTLPGHINAIVASLQDFQSYCTSFTVATS